MVPLRHFRMNDKFYEHVIYTTEDDRVELHDQDGKTILTYTAHCDVLDENGELVGRFSTRDGNMWFSQRVNGERHLHECYGVEALLDAEVEFSKQYLSELDEQKAST